jgi:hypothetical protein
MNSRRQFLLASTAAIAGATLPRGLFAQRIGGSVYTNASLGAYTQGLLTQANFEKVVGSVFSLFLDNYVADSLLLRAVTSSPTSAVASSAAEQAVSAIRPIGGPILPPRTIGKVAQQPISFQLHFNVSGASFGQDTYLLDHGTLGRFAAFLVPGSPGKCTASFCYLQNPELLPPVSRSTGIVVR